MDGGQFNGRIQKLPEENQQFGYIGTIAEFQGFCRGIIVGFIEKGDYTITATVVGVSNFVCLSMSLVFVTF